jgi:transcriptional regulator with XRE-family HTH domain
MSFVQEILDNFGHEPKRKIFKRYRESMGYLQEYVADAIGVTPVTVSHYETGKTEPKDWQAIFEALHKREYEFYQGKAGYKYNQKPLEYKLTEKGLFEIKAIAFIKSLSNEQVESLLELWRKA